MSGILRLPSLYFGVPLLFSCGVTLLSFHLPPGYLDGIALLAAVALATLLLDALLGIRLPPMTALRTRRYAGTREGVVALGLAAVVVLFCLLDLLLFPIPLLHNPSAYADLSPLRAQVRHISNMCWILPPIGLLCVRDRRLRTALLLGGFVFPVLVIDRNRLFAAVFSVGLLLVLRRDPARSLPWKRVLALLCAGTAAFALLGTLRSGSLDSVALPFGDLYRAAPQGIKWLLLYIGAGPYNFGALLAKHYVNASFLVNQLVPLSGSIATAGTGIPLDAPNINVGTEFLPFLLAGGAGAAVASMLALYVALLWSVRLLGRGVALFNLLVFLRIAYACVMSPFAPQAFTWTNAGFIALCLLLHVCSALLPNRRDGGDAVQVALSASPRTASP
ncbi:membrane protein [Xanthomonas sp. MUS 060]|uniref:membrane protein n=1 Tax=Xanthomonas sp. MUS 060 TaxID=1588031 RepID=UPI0005F286C5|nr:membrane protein [Xanthomonas sp. MUS 060]